MLAIGPFELTLVRSSPRAAEATEPVTRAMPSMRVAETVSVMQSLSVLSPREREVFVWFARGCLQREIAEHFGVSVKTIETHRTRIGQKLGLRTRAELLRFALDAGLLKSDN
jgi:DNA-binding CsgD family transcriptional regulator